MANNNKKYKVGKSKIQGDGAFAKNALNPGDYIGKVHTINKLYEDYDFTELGKKHNHSENPNVQNVLIGNERHLVAIKPIKKGEELFSDYRLQPDLEQPDKDFEKAKGGKKLTASKAEQGGWMDKYDVPQAQNGIEGTMGGLTDKGFNYNPAWGGAWKNGGLLSVNQFQEGGSILRTNTKLPLYNDYYDALGLSRDKIYQFPEGSTLQFDKNAGWFTNMPDINIIGNKNYSDFYNFAKTNQQNPFFGTPYNRLSQPSWKQVSSFSISDGQPTSSNVSTYYGQPASNFNNWNMRDNVPEWTTSTEFPKDNKIPLDINLEDIVRRGDLETQTGTGRERIWKNFVGQQRTAEKKFQEGVAALMSSGASEEFAIKQYQNYIKNPEGYEGLGAVIEDYQNRNYRIKNHPDYDPNKSFDEQSFLATDDSIRARLLRGANMLTNTGNPLIDLATGIVTAPGRAFANITTDAQNRYFNPILQGNVLEGATNFGLDLLDVAPTTVLKTASQVPQVTRQAGEYLTTQTPLKNVYKYNPWAFQPDVEAAYRMIGNEEGLASALESGYFKPSTIGSDIGKVHTTTHYTMGAPSDTRNYFGRSWGRGYKGPYMVEVPGATNDIRFAQGIGGKEMGADVFTFPENYIPVSDAKLYKQDWLKGYKQIKPKFKGGKIKNWLDEYQNGGNIQPPMAGAIQTVPMAQMVTSLPGSTGMMYARTAGAAPSEGPYAKKTLPSAQDGMTFYQHGLDWKPRNISRDGSSVNRADEYPLQKLDDLLNFTNYNKPKAKSGGWLDKYN